MVYARCVIAGLWGADAMRMEVEESRERHLEMAFSKSYGSFYEVRVVEQGERVQESDGTAGAYAGRRKL